MKINTIQLSQIPSNKMPIKAFLLNKSAFSPTNNLSFGELTQSIQLYTFKDGKYIRVVFDNDGQIMNIAGDYSRYSVYLPKNQDSAFALPIGGITLLKGKKKDSVIDGFKDYVREKIANDSNNLNSEKSELQSKILDYIA